VTVAALRPRTTGIFRAEALKLRRQRSLWVMVAGAFVLLAVVVLASTTAPSFKDDLKSDPSRYVNDVVQVYGTVFQIGSGIFLLVVASRLLAMEYSAGTIRVLYARGAGRLQLLLTKMAALFVLGLVLLAGFLVVVAVIALLTVEAWSGSTAPLTQVSVTEWQNVARAVAFYVANLGILVLVAAAAAGLGRSLSFAIPAAMVLFPADNFLTVICNLVARVTGHPHPWTDITQWLLGPNLNYVLTVWETTRPRPAFAVPLVPVDLTHVTLVISGWAVLLAAIAVVRAVRPDVLE
jgi:ABC-2 type transport system permease protein